MNYTLKFIYNEIHIFWCIVLQIWIHRVVDHRSITPKKFLMLCNHNLVLNLNPNNYRSFSNIYIYIYTWHVYMYICTYMCIYMRKNICITICHLFLSVEFSGINYILITLLSGATITTISKTLSSSQIEVLSLGICLF